VQFNDVAFAAHAIVTCLVTLSQFIPSLWGFDKRGGRGARVSIGILGLQLGSLLGVGIVILMVLSKQGDDPKTGWGWIDVVSTVLESLELSANNAISIDLRGIIYQGRHHSS
jgi:cystinosin